ncbi:hypothetical protein M9Y10_016201 [Tritrichomonas musculus]|uniref:Uncharacterized protein n=1 Tax=Tritrichomonas musculus TaxID=1915356 RepID=A0ABR2I5K5_9EUKA
MLNAKLEINGNGFNLVRVVCYLEEYDSFLKKRDKSSKRYLLRTPKLTSTQLNEEYQIKIPSYWTHGYVFLELKKKSFLPFLGSGICIPIDTREYKFGEKNNVTPMHINQVEVFLTLENEVFDFPRELPAGKKIRSPFIQIPFQDHIMNIRQWVMMFRVSKSQFTSSDPKEIIVSRDSSNVTQIDIGKDLNEYGKDTSRQSIHEYMKETPNHQLAIILPGFLSYDVEEMDFDIHYCVECPQYDEKDWYQPHVAEKEVRHFSWSGSGKNFVAANGFFICKDDDVEVVHIEPQAFFVDSVMMIFRNNNVKKELIQRVAEYYFKKYQK